MNGGGYFASCKSANCESASLRLYELRVFYTRTQTQTLLITPIFKIARLFLLKVANVNNRGFGLYII